MNYLDQILDQINQAEWHFDKTGTQHTENREIEIETPDFFINAKLELNFEYEPADMEVGIMGGYEFNGCSDATIYEISFFDEDGKGLEVNLGKNEIRKVEKLITKIANS